MNRKENIQATKKAIENAEKQIDFIKQCNNPSHSRIAAIKEAKKRAQEKLAILQIEPQIVLTYNHEKRKQEISFRLFNHGDNTFVKKTKFQILKQLSPDQKRLLGLIEIFKKLYDHTVPFKQRLENKNLIREYREKHEDSDVYTDVEMITLMDIFRDNHPQTIFTHD